MPTKRQYLSNDEVSRILDGYRFAITAGQTDEEIAGETGISTRTIQRWRLQVGLQRATRPTKKTEEINAISSFGEHLQDVKHRTRSSAVDGEWKPPAFVSRQVLDYSLFLQALDACTRLSGMTEEEVAQALGVTPLSIAQGLAIFNNVTKSNTCKHCKAKTNRAGYCSAHCFNLEDKRAGVP